jgi:RNA polymerase sigma-70 factor (ECF subfamily)
MIRTQKRRGEVSHDDDLVYKIVMDDSTASVAEAQSLLTKIFKREKPSTKLIALYHFVDGMSLEQTAKEVNMSVSGVRKRLRLLKKNSQIDNTDINN